MIRFGRAALAATSLLILAAAAPPPAPDLPRAITADPPTDAANPAKTLPVEIDSHGSSLNGILLQPSGAGPFPLVVLGHGLPGNEENLDLAQALRRAGWAVLTYHFRGAFGSEGYFSIDHVLEDMDAVIARAHNGATATKWNIDPKRIVVIGHSLGGLAAAHAAAAAPDRLGTVLIAPWDPSVLKKLMDGMSKSARDDSALTRWSDVSHGRLAGTTTPAIADTMSAQGDTWKLADNAAALAKRPLLIVTAKNDLESSKATLLMPALTAAGGKPATVEIDSSHTFDDHRIALQVEILRWIAKLPGAPTS